MPALAWTPLHARLHQTIRHRGLFAKGQSILIALSGGQDSLCLAQLLFDLQPRWDWNLAIAHCDHRWAIDSPQLPAHVQSIAETWHLPFYLASAPDEVAQDSREATARRWRYQALTKLAQAHHFSSITTAHTASDRAETLLYNLIRGSGMDGFSALRWSRSLTADINLVRPILNMTRAETGNFCDVAGLPVWDDPANTDLRYARNRIRNNVLPYLQQHFNPNIESILATTSEVIQADVDYLEAEANRLFQNAVDYQCLVQRQTFKDVDEVAETLDGYPILRINRHVLQSQPLSLQRRVMRRCLFAILPKAPTFEHIEKLSALIDAPNRSQTDPFPGGAIAVVDHDWIHFTV